MFVTGYFELNNPIPHEVLRDRLGSEEDKADSTGSLYAQINFCDSQVKEHEKAIELLKNNKLKVLKSVEQYVSTLNILRE